MHYTRKRIVMVSLLLEGGLTVVYFVWWYCRCFGEPLCAAVWHYSGLADAAEGVFIGTAAAVPLFGLNYLLFGPLSHRVRFLSSCFEFKDRIVKPLARELDMRSAGMVALCAGVGEELFFRGLLQTEFGLAFASFAFSFLHFGPAVKKYLFIAALYVVIGAYFGLLFARTESLLVPIVTHVVYDFFALLYMRYAYVSPERSSSGPRPV